ENDEENEWDDDIQPSDCPLLVLKAAAPDHLISLWKLYGGVDFLHGFIEQTPHVSTPHPPFDRDPPYVSPPEHPHQPFPSGDFGKLSQWNARAVRRTYL